MEVLMRHFALAGALFLVGAAMPNLAQAQTEPLPSWNDGAVKKAITDFVAQVTTPGGPGFVPAEQRIAAFDNDGTLWAEQPMYIQLVFAFDRVKALAPQHPEWKTEEPFASLLKGDVTSALAGGEPAVFKIAMATLSGMTTEEFDNIVRDWIATARHPKTGRLYTEMVYQPMIELLAYLRANDFKTFIVSGGGIEFMRPWVEKVYGVPPEQVVGSALKLKLESRDGKPVLVKLPEIDLVNDGPGKPVGIQMHIGRRPILAFGNSDGDLAMLQWTAAGSGSRFMGLVHHTDAVREWAYDRQSSFGRLDKALDEANATGWVVIDMKKDWNKIFPVERVNAEASPVTAIDIALEPDATMMGHAQADNARLLKVFPKGFALDATHHPHVTMLQQFVRTADLDKVYAAANKVLAKEKAAGWKLKAIKYYYIPSPPLGLAGIVVEPTEDLLRLQQELIEAIEPYTEKSGTPAAFMSTEDGRDIQQDLIKYVANFVAIAAGAKFNPHVTIGVGTEVYLKEMLAEPFVSFTFSPAGASVYQLGSFGTARKELTTLELSP
jgi:hypothetical protein